MGAATDDDGQVVPAAAPHSCWARVRTQYGTGHSGSSMCPVAAAAARARLCGGSCMRAAGQGDSQDSARAFACARCGAQVLVCRHCDRGQRYCGLNCARPARRESLREAGRRYQCSRAGRFAHARRARRYRQRRSQQKIVTHHGSQAPDERATVGLDPPATPRATAAEGTAPAPWHCHWCTRACASLVRRGFLRHERIHGASPKPQGGVHGQSP